MNYKKIIYKKYVIAKKNKKYFINNFYTFQKKKKYSNVWGFKSILDSKIFINAFLSKN